MHNGIVNLLAAAESSKVARLTARYSPPPKQSTSLACIRSPALPYVIGTCHRCGFAPGECHMVIYIHLQAEWPKEGR